MSAPKSHLACFRCHERKSWERFPLARSRTKRSRVCWACVEAEAHAIEERRAARRATWFDPAVRRWVRRCPRCRQVLDLERDYYLRARLCKPCLIDHVARQKRKRRAADPDAFHAKHNAAQGAWRLANPEKAKAASDRYRQKLMADPVRKVRFLESRRIEHALRQERRGKSVVKKQRTAIRREETLPKLPAAPLAAFVDSLVGRDGRPATDLCHTLGITDRDLRAWRTGERETVQYDVADRVMTNTGANLHDIWPDDERMAA